MPERRIAAASVLAAAPVLVAALYLAACQNPAPKADRDVLPGGNTAAGSPATGKAPPVSADGSAGQPSADRAGTAPDGLDAQAASRRLSLARGHDWQLPVEPGFTDPIDETQTIVAQFGERSAVLVAKLRGSARELAVTLLSSSGPRIIDVTWHDGKVSETRHALAPDAVSGRAVLGDIYLVMASTEALERALPEGLELRERDGLREILAGTEPLVVINYRDRDDRNRERVRFRHLERSYELSIHRR